MAFTLIVGPMKSGKTLELVARTAPYEFAKKKVTYIKPIKDVRSKSIASRAGINAKAVQVNSLADVNIVADVIGIDEIHMFPASDSKILRQWLKEGREIVASGLDLDYTATLTPTIKALLELKPDTIITKVAVCEECHSYDAKFSQILLEGKPVLEGLPPVVPEDGSYQYQPRCANCFQVADKF
jgi:thymidine kinase